MFALLSVSLCLCGEVSAFDYANSSLPAPQSAFAPPTLTAAWNPVPGALGYALSRGIISNQYSWGIDTGTNTQVTFTVPGGFQYWFAVRAWNHQLPTTYTNQPRQYSAWSADLTITPACPPGEPQLLITNGVWLVMCEDAGGGSLQSSRDLLKWQTVGNIPTNAPALFLGPAAGNQFFRIKL